MDYFDALMEILNRWAHLGSRVTQRGVRLIGQQLFRSEWSYLHCVYEPLDEAGLGKLQASLGRPLPPVLREFYAKANGLYLFNGINGALGIQGLRHDYGRELCDESYQPVSLEYGNAIERVKGHSSDMTFFGWYKHDGSNLYCRDGDSRVFMCPRLSVEPTLCEWPDFQTFLLSETERLAAFFSADGRQIDEKMPTIPPEALRRMVTADTQSGKREAGRRAGKIALAARNALRSVQSLTKGPGSHRPHEEALAPAPFEEESSGAFRPAAEVAKRCLVLYAVVAAGHREPRRKLARWLQKVGLWEAVSPAEAELLQAEAMTERQEIVATWRVEALFTLLWALGKVATLPPPVELCDVQLVRRVLPPLFSSAASFIMAARLRGADEILQASEEIYDIHWAVRDAQIHGRPIPQGYNPGVVQERHYALNWLAGSPDQGWDDVATDT